MQLELNFGCSRKRNHSEKLGIGWIFGNMSMVELGNCWDTVVNGIGEEEDFENILKYLDFPMESIEEEEAGSVADWDISKSHCLGPIPSNVIMEPPKIPNCKFDTEPPYLFSGLVTPVAGDPQQKQLSGHIETYGSYILEERKFAEIQESGMFQTQSPVSVLESNGSHSAGKSLPTIYSNAIPVRARSKRARRANVSPWLLTSPLFSTTLELLDASTRRPAITKKCTHCEVTTTPQWREGPLGPKSLCNACGVRYRSGRLFPEYRPAASPTFVPSLHSTSASKQTSNAKKDEPRRSRRMKPPHRLVPVKFTKDPLENFENSSQESYYPELQDASTRHAVVTKKCTHCEITKTPQWREGPLGPKTLCNACGVRYRSGRLFPEYRPAASPTFVPSLHSNSHKKVVEMRTKAKQIEIEEAASLSPQPEFVPMSSYLFDYIN